MAALLVGCAELSSVSALLNDGESESEFEPEVQNQGQVEVVVVQPTPTTTSRSEETIPPILFTSSRGATGTLDIYQVNADGSGLLRLTNDPANESDPSWSPDRQEIAFASDRSGVNQIYLLSIEDMKVTQLTNHPLGAVSPTWSPDGSQIAFAEQDPESSAILLINIHEGSAVSRIPLEVSGVNNPAWAAKGNTLAFSARAGEQAGERDVFSFNLDSQALVNLTNQAGTDDTPDCAPNVDRLLFQTDRDGD